MKRPEGDIRHRLQIDLLGPTIFGAGVKINTAFVSKLLADETEPISGLGQVADLWSTRVSVDGTDKIEGLSRPEYAAHLFLWCYGEVGNGGHSQYLLNAMRRRRRPRNASMTTRVKRPTESLQRDDAASLIQVAA